MINYVWNYNVQMEQIEEQYYMFDAVFDEKNSTLLNEEIFSCINIAKALII